MLQITMEIVDGDKALAALDKFSGTLKERLESFLKREGAEMEREIKNELAVSARAGTGPRGGQLWIPSAPGDPPAKRTGELQASIGHEVTVQRQVGQSSAGAEFALDVGSMNGGAEVNYAEDLELGTSKMAARPFIMPVAIAHVQQWPDGIKAEVEEIRP